MMCPEGGVGGRGNKARSSTHFPMVSKTSLQHARKVVRLAGRNGRPLRSGRAPGEALRWFSWVGRCLGAWAGWKRVCGAP
jgi:hypothetical protein